QRRPRPAQQFSFETLAHNATLTDCRRSPSQDYKRPTTPCQRRTKLDSGHSGYNGPSPELFVYCQAVESPRESNRRTCSSISEYSQAICLSDNTVEHPDATFVDN